MADEHINHAEQHDAIVPSGTRWSGTALIRLVLIVGLHGVSVTACADNDGPSQIAQGGAGGQSTVRQEAVGGDADPSGRFADACQLGSAFPSTGWWSVEGVDEIFMNGLGGANSVGGCEFESSGYRASGTTRCSGSGLWTCGDISTIRLDEGAVLQNHGMSAPTEARSICEGGVRVVADLAEYNLRYNPFNGRRAYRWSIRRESDGVLLNLGWTAGSMTEIEELQEVLGVSITTTPTCTSRPYQVPCAGQLQRTDYALHIGDELEVRGPVQGEVIETEVGRFALGWWKSDYEVVEAEFCPDGGEPEADDEAILWRVDPDSAGAMGGAGGMGKAEP